MLSLGSTYHCKRRHFRLAHIQGDTHSGTPQEGWHKSGHKDWWSTRRYPDKLCCLRPRRNLRHRNTGSLPQGWGSSGYTRHWRQNTRQYLEEAIKNVISQRERKQKMWQWISQIMASHMIISDTLFPVSYWQITLGILSYVIHCRVQSSNTHNHRYRPPCSIIITQTRKILLI